MKNIIKPTTKYTDAELTRLCNDLLTNNNRINFLSKRPDHNKRIISTLTYINKLIKRNIRIYKQGQELQKEVILLSKRKKQLIDIINNIPLKEEVKETFSGTYEGFTESVIKSLRQKIKIHWNGFLGICCNAYPGEACAMLYAKKPFSSEQEWYVYPIMNIHPEPKNGWLPDIKELAKMKRQTDKEELVKIGNVHSHPLPPINDNQELSDYGDMCDLWKRYSNPSGTDLRFAKKFNDIIRGILVVDSEGVYEQGWHDKYGEMYELHLIEDGL